MGVQGSRTDIVGLHDALTACSHLAEALELVLMAERGERTGIGVVPGGRGVVGDADAGEEAECKRS